MTLRYTIAEAVLAYRTGNNGMTASETSDAILDVIREGVKLEWEDVEPDELFGITSRADCVFPGEYSTYVIYDDDAGGEGGVVGESGSFWFEGGSTFNTLEAAKAAAQADYTRRILSALGIDQ